MNERQTPEARRPRTDRTLTSVGVVIAAAALAVALFVVVRSSRNVRPEPLPASLKTAPPDTGLVAFRASIRRKVMNLSARCKSKRKDLGSRMTPTQDSLSRECDSATASVLARVAALDTVARASRKATEESVRAEYNRAKLKVRDFTHSGRRSDMIDEDSLDQEIKKLINE
jgi:hypothetical protein